jgi:hypothetical protein
VVGMVASRGDEWAGAVMRAAITSRQDKQPRSPTRLPSVDSGAVLNSGHGRTTADIFRWVPPAPTVPTVCTWRLSGPTSSRSG